MSHDNIIIFDNDNPEWTEQDFAKAQPLSAFPELEAALKKRGRPQGSTKESKKQLISLRLDRELVEHLRSSGQGWQTRVNAILRAAVL
jgi:uncharacterized protein (DUF4415 family)